VEPTQVVIRFDRLGDLALDFKPDEKRLEKRASGDVEPFPDG